MLKNKKIVLSSIAIVFALVVSAIFVNYTLANSDSHASLSGAGSGKESTGLTGLSNIDLAVKNSNSSEKKESGEDKYRIVQIVPNSYSGLVEGDDSLKAAAEKSSSSKDTAATADTSAESSYLGSYVYSGEYFRLAVFNGYKTISESMAKGAVTLTTRTASYFDDLENNTEAQTLLNQADFVYIWAKSSSDYTKGDISEELYNWLDAYATSDSHPIAICANALCVDKLADIKGNNDDYRMGALAYKLITKDGVARFDNVLVTDSEFFLNLYNEASKNKKDPVSAAQYSLYRFIYNAETTKKDGGLDYLKNNTYFKWYTGTDVITFLDGQDGSHADSAYRPVGQMKGATKNRNNKDWKFDNARILVISENDSSDIFNELKQNGKDGYPINSATNNSIDSTQFSYDDATDTWKANVEKVPNSELTGHMYLDGVSNTNANVPSGAALYLLKSSDLKAGLDSGTTIKDMSLPNSAYQDVPTKSISGTVRVTDNALDDIDMSAVEVYLLAVAKDGSASTIKLAGRDSKFAQYKTDFVKSTEDTDEVAKDENGEPETDDDGNPVYVQRTIYKYSFDKLNPDYDYAVVIGADGADVDLKNNYTVGTKNSSDDGGSPVCDFYIGKAAEVPDENSEYVDGYTYRTDKDNKTDNNVIATVDDFAENCTLTGDDKAALTYNYPSDSNELMYDAKNKIDLSTSDNVKTYVETKWDAYRDSETAWKSTPAKINFSDFDFVFIDKGDYNDELGEDVYNSLCKAVTDGVYVIVSSEAGDPNRSKPADGDSSGSDPVVVSPSAKAVADVINAGVYRDGADNKYRVLEIQPDFPVDLDVAATKTQYNTAYGKRSDGSAIKGDYYTVPSDVVSGKSKEELGKNVEYYQFDLTKAKIANAIDGVNYGDIELTQVSTEKLVGMKDDIASTYDLVYIGGDISALDRDLTKQYGGQNNLGNSSAGYTYMALPSFIMYYHTGILNQLGTASIYSPDRSSIKNGPLMATPHIGNKYYADTYIAENGNDLSQTKYDELVAYIASGRPIMLSDELTDVYEKMQATGSNGNKLSYIELMQGYWYNKDSSGNLVLERKNIYLDPSSEMYRLMDHINSVKNSSSNILWGYDVDSVSYISDEDGKYGTSLYTVTVNPNGKITNRLLDQDAQKQGWYKKKKDDNGNTVLKKYQVVMSDDMKEQVNQLVQSSSQRVRLTMINKPVSYQQGILSTYIKTNRLQFEFTVGDEKLTNTYNYKLYVDVDRNTKFADTSKDTELLAQGTAKGGETVKTPVVLDEKYYGAAAWYLEITDGDDNVVASRTDVCKIVNNDNTSSRINVLQVQTMAEGQSAATWTATDALYFDITSQTAHKIAKYNIYANQTEYDNVDPKQYKVLGLHENRFGINEYNMSTDRDDYYSNLADALGGDYDINLDMVVASKANAGFVTDDGYSDSYDCLETYVSEAEALETEGGKVDGKTKEEYKTMAENALDEYQTAKSATEAPKEALDEYLNGAVDVLKKGGSSSDYNDKYGSRGTHQSFFNGFNGNTTDADIIKLLEYEVETGDYYMMFWPVSSKNSEIFTNGEIGLVYGKDFRNLYIAYRDAKNAELTAKAKYNTYLRRSYGKDFLKKMYSILILGPSEGFGNFKTDFSVTTCNYILDYVNAGGDMFFFHDAMTPYANQGAVNLTKSLLDVVGMNRYHVDLTHQNNSYTSVNSQIKLTEEALVNKLVDTDGTQVYTKHDITANGQLEQGILSSAGYVYNKLDLKDQNGNTYTSDPNGLLEKSNDNSSDTTVYIQASSKDDPNNALAKIKLASDGTAYKMRDSASGFDSQTDIAAGTKYYTGAKLVYGSVKAGQAYFNNGWIGNGTQLHGPLYVEKDKDGNAGYVSGLYYVASAQSDTQGYYIENPADKYVYVSDKTGAIYDSIDAMSWEGTYKYYVEKTATGGESGYVMYTATKMDYIDSKGNKKNDAYFSQENGKAGDTAYVMISDASKESYIDTSYKVRDGWFVTQSGGSGFVKVTGAEKLKYVDSDGKVDEAYFSKKSGRNGSEGYIMIDDASQMRYLDADGDIKDGWFTVSTGSKGDYGYVMTQPGYIDMASGLLPNAMLRDSSSGQPYMTNYAFNTTSGEGIVSSMNANLRDAKEVSKIKTGDMNYLSDSTSVYVSGLAMTALYTNGNMAGATNTQPYVYAGATSFKKAVEWSSAANGADYSETMKAAQLNSGVVTKYPYNIGTSLNVAGTHQQAYALDLDNKNTTVWYTLAGSNNKSDAKNRSSKYAASPGDGMESYYIYTTSYGSGAITYCGSGHSSVTGKGKRNNDERKLFINVIVNSATAVPESPIITCFEPTGTFETKDELEKDVEASNQSGKKIYSLDVDTKTDSPEFDFEISIPEGTKLSKVRVFYDLDYLDKNGNVDYNLAPGFNDSDKDADGNDRTPDVLIKEYNKRTLQSVESSLKSTIRSDIDKLKLQESYFSPYGGFYTFIVVQVTYEDGTAPVYAIIKVKASDPLFNLTENTTDVPVIGDFVAEKKFIYA